MSNEDQSFILLEDAALDLKLSEAELVSTLRRNGMRVWLDFPTEDADRNGIGNWRGRLYFRNGQQSDDKYAGTPGKHPLEEKSMITLKNAIEQGKRAGERLMDLEIETPSVKQWERMFEGSDPRWRFNDPKLATSSRLPALLVLDSDIKKLQLSFRQEPPPGGGVGVHTPLTPVETSTNTGQQIVSSASKTSRNHHREVWQVFWRSFCALRGSDSIEPSAKAVWTAVFEEWKRIQESGDVFDRPAYDEREIIGQIDPVDTPNAQLVWEVRADNTMGAYHLRSLNSLLSRLKKIWPRPHF